MPRKGSMPSFKRRNNKPVPAKKSVPMKSPSVGSTIMGNVVTGATFGVGSGLGHAAVGAMMSGGSDNNQPVEAQQPIQQSTPMTCQILFDEYNKCKKDNMENFDKKDCSEYLKKAMEFKC